MARILCDVDGVICSFTDGYLQLVKQVTGIQYKLSDVTNWSFKKCLNLTDEQANAVHKLADQPGFIRSLSSLPGAYEGIYHLKKKGHEVVFVTSPWSTNPTWAFERTQWLEERFPGFPVVITQHKQYVQGDTLIDDYVENLNKWIKENKKTAYLWNAPYNQDEPPSLMKIRINDWNDPMFIYGQDIENNQYLMNLIP